MKLGGEEKVCIQCISVYSVVCVYILYVYIV